MREMTLMTMAKFQVLVTLLACLLPASVAQYPAIEPNQGFEVDMEPFWVAMDWEETNPSPLDVQGFFRSEMQTILPNLMGAVLKRYEDTKLESRTTSRFFYTGTAIFRGPPYRTNHEVFEAQTTALTALNAAASYIQVHNASMGTPDWFDPALLGDHNVKIMEETDSDPIDLNFGNDSGVTHMITGVGGFLVGIACTIAAMYCIHKKRVLKRSGVEAPMTPRRGGTPRHKRKTSGEDLSSIHNEGSFETGSSCNGSVVFTEQFHDEEEADEAPLTHSPHPKDLTITMEKPLSPLKRRPSHHRRWKSTAFHDMQSPSSVMDGLMLPTPNSAPSLPPNGGHHRRSNSMADAFKQPRRESMVDLLTAADMAELVNSENDLEEGSDESN